MMDWTDRHCRYFHRLVSPDARLYTEMVTTGALLHGDVPRHLDFDAAEHPLVLQLGGSEPDELARAAMLGADWGYDEINLNCGCPSERVQRGAFGACLMAEPALVRDCVRAMRDAVDLPITVKHRIGIDKQDSYSFVRDFVGIVSDGGAQHFIVHARNAWLKGLSPKQNREIPPLRYEFVYQLKKDFPHLQISLNGGVTCKADVAAHLKHVDSVMIGREAYHRPWFLAELQGSEPEREAIETQMIPYLEAQRRAGVPVLQAARHMLGLWQGEPGARRWRQVLSDHRLRGETAGVVFERAREARLSAALQAA